MKKFTTIIAILLALGAASQPITDTGALRSYINTVIIPNGTRAITGLQMNRVLNGFLTCEAPLWRQRVDSIWKVGTVLYFRKGGVTYSLLLPSGSDSSLFATLYRVDTAKFNIRGQVPGLARSAISLTTTGTSGAATYNSGTGVFNIPQYTGGGVTTMAAIGSISNSSGASISGSTLTLQPASASFGGVVTTGSQTFAGSKTFSSPILQSTSGVVLQYENGTNNRSGIGVTGASGSGHKTHFFTASGGSNPQFFWYSGNFQSSNTPSGLWMSLSASELLVNVPINVNDFNSLFSSTKGEKIRLYNGGTSNRAGLGITGGTTNGSIFHSFTGITGAGHVPRFVWYGGDFQNTTSPSNVWLEVNENYLTYRSRTQTQRDAGTPVAGTTVYCSDCTANDASTGVLQTYNGSVWKNHW